MSFRRFLANLFANIDPDEDGVRRINVRDFKNKETEFCGAPYKKRQLLRLITLKNDKILIKYRLKTGTKRCSPSGGRGTNYEISRLRKK